MEYLIARSDIPGELWRFHSLHKTEAEALSFEGAAGEYIVRVNEDGSSVALWRWDGKRWAKAELE